MPDDSSFGFSDALTPAEAAPPPPPVVGAPALQGGRQYSPEQMAKLNQSRAAILAGEKSGASWAYGSAADQPPAVAPDSFSFDDAGTPPASAGTTPPATDDHSLWGAIKQRFAGETPMSLYKQNMFASFATYTKQMADLAPDVIAAYDKAKADGSFDGSLFAFGQQNTAKMYQEKYGEPPPKLPTPTVDWLKLPGQMVKGIMANPARAIAEFAHSAVTDPEMFYMPEIGVAGAAAKLGRAAEIAGRAAEGGAEMGAQGAAIEATQQLKQGGEISDPNAIKQAAGSSALMGAGLTILHSAASLGLAKIARNKGATITPDATKQVAGEIDQQVAAGAQPTDALVSTLTKHGLDHKTASNIADAIEPYVAKEEPQTGAANAVQESQTGAVLQRQPAQAPGTGSERPGVEPSQQGQEAAAAGQAQAENQSAQEAAPIAASKDLDSARTHYADSVTAFNQSLRSQGVASKDLTSHLRQALGSKLDYGNREALDAARLRLQDYAQNFGAPKPTAPDEIPPLEFTKESVSPQIVKTERPGTEAPTEPDMTGVTPDRQLRVTLGKSGTRGIEFNDPMDKEVFQFASRAERRATGTDAELAANNAYIKANSDRIQNYLGIDDPKEALTAARAYRKQVIADAKGAPEGARVTARNAVTGAKAQDVSPIASTAPAITPVLQPEEGRWFHYARIAGLRELEPGASNKGNVRGNGVYLTKDPGYATAHSMPRVNAKGELGPAKGAGELLSTKLEPQREARMFDEGQMLDAEKARALLEDAGMTHEESGQVLGRKAQISGASVNAALKKFMGGWDYSNAFLKERGHTGVKFSDSKGNPLAVAFDNVKAEPARLQPGFREAGNADPKVLASIGLAGIGALGMYALSGDKTEAIEAAAAMGALPFARAIVSRLAKGTAQVMDAALKDQRFDTKQVFRDYTSNVHVPAQAIDAWRRGAQGLLRGDPGFDGSLNPLKLKQNTALRDAAFTRIRDYVQGYRDMTLSPREQLAATQLQKFFDYMGQRGVEGGVLRDLIDNYMPGIYQKKPFQSWTDLINAINQKDGYHTNYTGMSPSSRFALQKVIPNYRVVDQLIAEGKLDLIPLTKNPFDVAAVYGKSLTKSIANKKLVDTLKTTPGPTVIADRAVPLMVPVTTAEAEKKIWQTMAILRDKFELPKEATDMAARFATMNAPKDYVQIKHPALEGMRVHQDVVQPLKMVFDTSDPGILSRSLYSTSMLAKSMKFSFSLFHAGALASVALPIALGRAGAMLTRAATPNVARLLPDAYRMLKASELAPQVADAVQSGLTLSHHIEDVDPTIFQRAMNLAQTYARGMPKYTGMPLVGDGLKALAYAQKMATNFIFQQVQPTLKLATWMSEAARWAAKNADNPKISLVDAKRQIALATNQLYGGVNWLELANNVQPAILRSVATALFSPQGRRWQQVLFLSPDWNVATIDAWHQGLKASIPGITPKASDSLYRTYLLSSAATYLGAAYMLQQHFTKENIWDKPDWSYVDMGDGRKVQLNKHFMEGVHLISNPQSFFLNKLNFLPKEAIEQALGREYLTYEPGKNQPYMGPPMKDSSVTGRLEHAAKGFLSPITVENALNSPTAAVFGMTGVPIFGKTYAQQEELAREAARAKGGDEDAAVERVRQRMERDIAKRKVNP
ncbi:MAG: hypothetical protein KGI71_06510 [Patescibacteria group bacterium]|nr:hypothetical protein [Patescibacteria group bacterium]